MTCEAFSPGSDYFSGSAMFARFANPHALELLTKVTSRRELHASDDEGNDEEDREAIVRLETLLKRSLDASGSAPDAPKKKKRRKLADVEPEGESSAPEPQLAVRASQHLALPRHPY